MSALELNPNRYFDPDPAVRKIARELYQLVKDLPIVSPHGHVDPKILAENTPFPDPAELILIPDHYVHRMLYSQGIALESIGIPTIDGTEVETDHRKIWQIFAENFYLFSGTPTGGWLCHEFYEVFGIRKKLTGETAMEIYEQIQEKLNQPEYLPRALFKKFNIEVLSTTDAASDDLKYHQDMRESGWDGRVVPAFRPDAAINIAATAWKDELNALEEAVGYSIDSFGKFIRALEERRQYFKSMGATSTDQGVLSPYAHRLTDNEVETVFNRALTGKAVEEDAARFTAHMIMEMARMSIDDGLVMQLHPGSYRNHNKRIFGRFGLDKGCDIPIATEYTRNIQELLNTYGNDARLTLIVFTLDETCYTRELAPLAGHYPAMKLGPAWWFHDSFEGMNRYRHSVTETAGIYNTVGFNDDTRAFPSIPARHDLARRVDSNFLAGKVARHIIDMEDARRMIHDLSYGLVKRAYKL